MRIKTIALATAFALSNTLAFAQAGGNTAGGSSAAGGPAASKTTTGDSKDGATTLWRGQPHERCDRDNHRQFDAFCERREHSGRGHRWPG